MTRESDKDVARIVAGMSEADQGALRRAEPDGHLGHLFLRWWQANGPILRSMERRGLGSSVWSGLVLTPLGLRVRAALNEDKEHG